MSYIVYGIIGWLFYAAFKIFRVISWRFMGKLSVLLVHLSWHQHVSHNANPESLSANDGSQYYHY